MVIWRWLWECKVKWENVTKHRRSVISIFFGIYDFGTCNSFGDPDVNVYFIASQNNKWPKKKNDEQLDFVSSSEYINYNIGTFVQVCRWVRKQHTSHKSQV